MKSRTLVYILLIAALAVAGLFSVNTNASAAGGGKSMSLNAGQVLNITTDQPFSSVTLKVNGSVVIKKVAWQVCIGCTWMSGTVTLPAGTTFVKLNTSGYYTVITIPNWWFNINGFHKVTN